MVPPLLRLICQTRDVLSTKTVCPKVAWITSRKSGRLKWHLGMQPSTHIYPECNTMHRPLKFTDRFMLAMSTMCDWLQHGPPCTLVTFLITDRPQHVLAHSASRVLKLCCWRHIAGLAPVSNGRESLLSQVYHESLGLCYSDQLYSCSASPAVLPLKTLISKFSSATVKYNLISSIQTLRFLMSWTWSYDVPCQAHFFHN